MSPCRVDLVGNKPAEPEENEMCVTDEICKDYANYKMKQNFITSLSSSLSTHINPIFDVDNIIAISDGYFNFDYAGIDTISKTTFYRMRNHLLYLIAQKMEFL